MCCSAVESVTSSDGVSSGVDPPSGSSTLESEATDDTTGGLCCTAAPKSQLQSPRSQGGESLNFSDAYVATDNNNEPCLKDHKVNRETVAEISESHVKEEAVSCVSSTQPLPCQDSSVGLSLSPSDVNGQSVDMSVDAEQRSPGDSQLSNDAEIAELTENIERVPKPTNCDGNSTRETSAPCEDEIMFDENVNPFKTNTKVGFSPPPPGGDGVTLDNSRLPIDLDDPFKCSTKMANSPPPSPVNVPSESVEALVLSPVNNTPPLTEVISDVTDKSDIADNSDVTDKSDVTDRSSKEKTSCEIAK